MRAGARALLRQAVPSPRRGAPGVAAGILQAVSTVALLACSAYLITRASEQPPVLYLSMAVVGVRAFALAKAVFRYLERYASHDAVFRQLSDIRVGVLARLIPLAPDGLSRSRRGSVLSAVVDDVDDMQNVWLRARLPLLTSAGVSLASVVFVAFFSVPAAVWLLVSLVLCVVVSVALSSAVAARSDRELSPRRARLADAAIDYVQSLDVLTAYGALPAAQERIHAADAELTRAQRARAVAESSVSALNGLFAGAASLGALVLAAPALGITLSGPMLAVVVLVPLAVFEVVASLPLALASRRSVRASAERIAATIPDERPPEIPADSEPRQGEPSPLPATGPAALTLSDLRVRWPGAASATIDGLDLDVRPGERVWLDGESGSGKTTLAHTLVRFLGYEGSARLGGHELSALPTRTVREHIGLIEQTPYLFNDTIRQNLLFARDTADGEELEHALQLVGLGDWLAERGGLDARVGERGALVSGGQAQRIALARALLHEFPILVLDEPTANVDQQHAESLLTELLGAAARGGRTVILISHDDVPEHLVDRRLRMASGRLAAR
ncbi:thiol reductant ABC exporter subunit CydC [Mycetocola reblochoni]|uniref:Transport ATP-binding protein CydC n=2 Tax=Mycetocola reblochoni TaxID=331618 RepID=A0A1R4JED5_9MICO|nr:thiol reductant ABC exporter subunit CydC [Mycetocola reblochoni]RLP69906.1 thiol reductant ABC exporter subunit CydC [Mycetocola reblochoni]SJN30349.1 Transport ATP-binding protein CydC [Mycetocola reblochoni REB411]